MCRARPQLPATTQAEASVQAPDHAAAMRKAAAVARRQLHLDNSQAAEAAQQQVQVGTAHAQSGPAVNVAVHRAPEVRLESAPMMCSGSTSLLSCIVLAAVDAAVPPNASLMPAKAEALWKVASIQVPELRMCESWMREMYCSTAQQQSSEQVTLPLPL